jgi:hypothetical protein
MQQAADIAVERDPPSMSCATVYELRRYCGIGSCSGAALTRLAVESRSTTRLRGTVAAMSMTPPTWLGTLMCRLLQNHRD